VFKDIGEECFTETDPLTIFRAMYLENIKILEEFKEETDAKLEDIKEKVAILSKVVNFIIFKLFLNFNIHIIFILFFTRKLHPVNGNISVKRDAPLQKLELLNIFIPHLSG